MYQYPKQILTIAQQVQSYIDAGMVITSRADVENALKSVGFYRLRGYSFHLYDNATKKYVPGTKFEDIIKLYLFDRELSGLIFSMISKIEVSLRVRLVESLLIHGDPLVLQDSSIFKDKKLYWQNMSTVASEIARSNDVFIKHNFDNHDGEVPVWAAVEVLSFGTLSKIIKNLKTGIGSSYSILAANYQYKTKKGNWVNPSQKMFASWIQGISILGGEPCEEENEKALLPLLRRIKRESPNSDTWLYTGYTYEQLEGREILRYVDVLVDGPFLLEQKDISLAFRGSRNQRILRLKGGKPI